MAFSISQHREQPILIGSESCGTVDAASSLEMGGFLSETSLTNFTLVFK